MLALALTLAAPILAFAPVFVLFAIVPVGPTTQIFGKEVALVVARFNSFIVESLVQGALDVLRRHGVPLLDREIVTPDAVVIEQESAVRPVDARPAPRWGRQ